MARAGAACHAAGHTIRPILHAIYQRLAERFCEQCERQRGERLVSLVPYGSVARGTMRFDSNIDVLIVADPLPAGRLARVAQFEAIEQRLAPDLAAAPAQI